MRHVLLFVLAHGQGENPAALEAKLDDLLKRNGLAFELRTTTPEEVCYEVKLPLDKKTDRLSNVLMQIDPANATAVEWEDKQGQDVTSLKF